jgi:hypothetical protein
MWPFAPAEVRTVMAQLDAIESEIQSVPDDLAMLNDHVYNVLGLIGMVRNAAVDEWELSESVDTLTMIIAEIDTLVQQTQTVAQRSAKPLSVVDGLGTLGRPLYLMLAELQFLSGRVSDLMLAVSRIRNGLAHG